MEDTLSLGALKLAAIDAFMADLSNSQGVPGGWVRQNDRYCMSQGATYWYVSRPDSQGGGGGVFSTSSMSGWGLNPSSTTAQDCQTYTTQYQAAFDTIRSQVDTIFAPFQDLPKPENFDGPIDEVKTWEEALYTTYAAGAAPVPACAPDGSPLPGLSETSQLDGFMQTLDACMGQLAGGAITAFKTYFVNNIPPTIKHYHDLASVLLSGLIAEQALWSVTTGKVDELVASSTAAFNSCATGQPLSWNFFDDISKALSDIVEATASKDVLRILTGMVETVRAADAEKDRNPDAFGLADFTKPMDTLKASADSLNSQIKNQEEEFSRCLIHDNSIASDPDPSQEWNLDNYVDGVDSSQDLGLRKIDVVSDPEWWAELFTTMTELSDHLRDIFSRVDRQTDSRPWLRDDRIGLGYNGCFFSWDSLRWTLRSLLQDLAEELDDATRRLRRAATDLAGTNDEVRRMFDRMNR